MVVHNVNCFICGEKKAVARCSGCGIRLCESCAHFEIVGSGCGHIIALNFCIECAFDGTKNPHAGLLQR